MFWELFFMLVILKIPVVYLCAVVWWAIRAEPQPLEGAARLAVPPVPGPRCDWRRRRPSVLWRRRLPHGTRPRSRPPARVAYARAEVGT